MKFDWYRLFRPCFWIQNEPTNWEWDAVLNAKLDENPDIELSRNGHTVFIGGIEVWVSNYPYAYGYPYRPNVERLPSGKTRARLHKIVSKLQAQRLRILMDGLKQ